MLLTFTSVDFASLLTDPVATSFFCNDLSSLLTDVVAKSFFFNDFTSLVTDVVGKGLFCNDSALRLTDVVADVLFCNDNNVFICLLQSSSSMRGCISFHFSAKDFLDLEKMRIHKNFTCRNVIVTLYRKTRKKV